MFVQSKKGANMSTDNDDPSFENGKKSCPDTGRHVWERPTVRRLAANQAQAGHAHRASEGAHVNHECS